MQLRKTSSRDNVSAAQIIGIHGKFVTVKTEYGSIIQLPLSKRDQSDHILLQSLRDIWHAKIWLPVNTKKRRLFKYDWLLAPAQSEN